MLRRARSLVRRFHQEVAGNVPVETIMTIGLAAIICLGVAKMAGVDIGGGTTGGGFIQGVGKFVGGLIGFEFNL